jgi:hypothetical protein
MPEFIRYFDEKKFMWDNIQYPDAAAARTAAEAYEKDGFEVRIVEEGDSALVYSRRVAAEVVVEGQQPI